MKAPLLAAALILLTAVATTARADEFSDLEQNPNGYWVPPEYAYNPPPGYYGNPPPVYYDSPPPPLIRGGLFFHFHIH